MTFTAAQILRKKERWREVADTVSRKGGFVRACAWDFIKAGQIDLFHAEFMDKKRVKVHFNGKKYACWEDLKHDDIANYPSVTNNSAKVWARIRELLDKQAIVQFDPALDTKDKTYSPLHYIETVQQERMVKARLIYHGKHNFMYKKPSFSLPMIEREIDTLCAVSELQKEDMKSCFHQFGLSEESSYELCFKFEWEGSVMHFRWLCLPFGLSAASFIVQSLNEIVTDFYSLVYGKFCIVYLGGRAYLRRMYLSRYP